MAMYIQYINAKISDLQHNMDKLADNLIEENKSIPNKVVCDNIPIKSTNDIYLKTKTKIEIEAFKSSTHYKGGISTSTIVKNYLEMIYGLIKEKLGLDESKPIFYNSIFHETNSQFIDYLGEKIDYVDIDIMKYIYKLLKKCNLFLGRFCSQ